MQEFYSVWIAVSKDRIKTVKTALECSKKFDRDSKILRLTESSHEDYQYLFGQKISLRSFDSLVPTTIKTTSSNEQDNLEVVSIWQSVQLDADAENKLSIFTSRKPLRNDTLPRSSNSPVAKAVQVWLETIPDISRATIHQIVDEDSWNYQVYTPLLLLGSSTFASKRWQNIIKTSIAGSKLLELYASICMSTKCTHLAVNAPIPLHEQSTSYLNNQLNVMRSPSGLVPLHGDFGNVTSKPSEAAFNQAFWVSTKQNDIHQTFAPLHTMFSRGNIKEKARIVQKSMAEDKPFTAVDLYAGIGYFAFSYTKGGASLVLGWEINGWSVEGFRRGSDRNGWKFRICRQNDCNPEKDIIDPGLYDDMYQTRLAIFEESNEFAATRVKHMRATMPPVRHVNCGYLPSSKDSWGAAVQCLDPILGGCIHAHENVAVEALEVRQLEIEEFFGSLVAGLLPDLSMIARCEHVEHVKSYAPGVIHCVFDIRISRT